MSLHGCAHGVAHVCAVCHVCHVCIPRSLAAPHTRSLHILAHSCSGTRVPFAHPPSHTHPHVPPCTSCTPSPCTPALRPPPPRPIARSPLPPSPPHTPSPHPPTPPWPFAHLGPGTRVLEQMHFAEVVGHGHQALVVRAAQRVDVGAVGAVGPHSWGGGGGSKSPSPPPSDPQVLPPAGRTEDVEAQHAGVRRPFAVAALKTVPEEFAAPGDVPWV